MSTVMNAFGPWRVRLPLLALLAATVGCLDPVVGTKCGDYYQQCGGQCVDTLSSAQHCGACDNPCKGKCTDGRCVMRDGSTSSSDAGNRLGDAGESDALAVADAAPILDTRPPDITPPVDARTVSPDAVDAPVLMLADADVDAEIDAGTGAATDADWDAATDSAGADDAPDASNDGADAAPEDTAPPPVDVTPDLFTCDGGGTACGFVCVNAGTDPDNCGQCGNRCGSGLCMNSLCQQAGAGHVVVIGHDYQTGRVGVNRLVGSAVFLAVNNPARVLAYEGMAAAGAIQGTNAAIQQVATDAAHGWNRTVVAAADVPARLASFDVFLIYAQAAESDAGLNKLGLDWTLALKSFLDAGKIVILLDGASAANAGTYQIVQTAGLFKALSRTEVTGETLTVVSPGDAIATYVPRTYRAEVTSVQFDTMDKPVVVQSPAGRAVAVHLVF